MSKIEPKFQKLTVTFENVDQAQAIALKQMFEYMQYLGNVGSSRTVSFFSDGDGNFRPKVTVDYPEELPKLKNPAMGIVKWNPDTKKLEGCPVSYEGDFMIDFDNIAWEIFH